MKAIQINNYGGSNVISINDNVPIPKVPPGKVLVEVKASGS